jgi:hypothetical protein
MQLHCPIFLCTHVALKSENNAVQKTLTTMVTTESPNLVQNNSPNILALSILTMHHPLSLSWKGAPILRLPSNHFLQKHPFSPEFMECMNLQTSVHQEEKQGHF